MPRKSSPVARPADYTPAATVGDYARQAIVTRYAGPTDNRGSRVVVTAEAGRMVVSWDHALDVYANHAAAARVFADHWGWSGQWVGGATPDGYAWVLVPR